MNTITIELSAEDRARLDKIIELLAGGATTAQLTPAPDRIQDATQRTLERVEDNPPAEWVKPAMESVDAPVTPSETPAPAPDPALAYRLADIQQKVVALSAAGKKAEVRDIVKSYAEKVSMIPVEKFNEVMEKLAALED